MRQPAPEPSSRAWCPRNDGYGAPGARLAVAARRKATSGFFRFERLTFSVMSLNLRGRSQHPGLVDRYGRPVRSPSGIDRAVTRMTSRSGLCSALLAVFLFGVGNIQGDCSARHVDARFARQDLRTDTMLALVRSVALPVVAPAPRPPGHDSTTQNSATAQLLASAVQPDAVDKAIGSSTPRLQALEPAGVSESEPIPAVVVPRSMPTEPSGHSANGPSSPALTSGSSPTSTSEPLAIYHPPVPVWRPNAGGSNAITAGPVGDDNVPPGQIVDLKSGP